MWLVDWLIARWSRVWTVFESGYNKIDNVCVRWYAQAEWVVSSGYGYITDVAYYWRDKIKKVTQTWYAQAEWVLSTGYSLITDVAYYWRDKIKAVTQTWYSQAEWVLSTSYSRITDVAYYWYDKLKNVSGAWYETIRTLYERRDDFIYLVITSIAKLKSILGGTNWDKLIAFLGNPGPWLWAYVIGLAEDKLSELLDVYW